jgi:hypothetical protein
MDDIYGDVGKDETFRKAFADWLTMVWRDGTAKALQAYINA